MNKRTKRALALSILLMVLILACTCNPSELIPSLGEDTPVPPGQDTPAPPGRDTPLPPAANALFDDDFSDPNSGWEVGDYTHGSVGYKNGAYSVSSETAEQMMWGLANRDFDDVSIEVDATQVSAPDNDNNAYGVGCRVQPNDDGYYLRISGDGYYSIGLAEGGGIEYLVEWSTSSAIRQGNATNHLRVVCDGSTLILFVNGQQLASAQDSTFASGDIALAATTFEDTPTEILFDNIVVRPGRGQ